jgi:predicted nucleic acid-binding protein
MIYYLLDANVLMDMLDTDQEIIDKVEEVISKGAKIFIDGISYYQTKRRYLSDNNTKQLKELEKLSQRHEVVLHDKREIFELAADNWATLKKNGKKLRKSKHDADILIASNAMHRELTLVSKDSHFDFCEQILRLKRENWKS